MVFCLDSKFEWLGYDYLLLFEQEKMWIAWISKITWLKPLESTPISGIISCILYTILQFKDISRASTLLIFTDRQNAYYWLQCITRMNLSATFVARRSLLCIRKLFIYCALYFVCIITFSVNSEPFVLSYYYYHYHFSSHLW